MYDTYTVLQQNTISMTSDYKVKVSLEASWTFCTVSAVSELKVTAVSQRAASIAAHAQSLVILTLARRARLMRSLSLRRAALRGKD